MRLRLEIGAVVLVATLALAAFWVASRPRGMATFMPATFACDEPRVLTVDLGREFAPDDALTLEVYRGGQLGVAVTYDVATLLGDPGPDGTYRVEADAPGGLDCELGPGSFQLVVKASGAVIAETSFTVLAE